VLMRLAEIGLIAAAPNFYHRRPPGEDPVASMKQLNDAELLVDVRTTLAFLQTIPSVDPARVATVGHCLGGRTSFLALVHDPVFAAAVLLYHGNIFETRSEGMAAPFALTLNIHCPILGIFGSDDVNPSPAHVSRLSQELARLGIRHEFHSYEGAGHAFQDFHAAAQYRPRAADDAWEKIIAFLRRELKPAGQTLSA